VWSNHDISWANEMCLNAICRKVPVGKHFSESYSAQTGLKQGDALSLLPFNFVLEYTIRKVMKHQEDRIWMGHISSAIC
jgi:hypothetical protein